MKCYHESFGGKHILPVCRIRDMDGSKIKRNNFMGRSFLRILALPQIAYITGARFFSLLLWLHHQIHYRWIMSPAHNYKGRTTVPSGSCSFLSLIVGERHLGSLDLHCISNLMINQLYDSIAEQYKKYI